MTTEEELKEKIKKLALQVCNDRYLCEKAGLDYNNPNYTESMIYVLQQRKKNV